MADYLEVQLVERIDLIVTLDVLMKELADGSTAEEFLTKFVVVQAEGGQVALVVNAAAAVGLV